MLLPSPSPHYTITPKTLSLTPRSIPHKTLKPNPKPHKPIITCKITQTHQNPPSFKTQLHPKPSPDPNGSGPAAPTRGELFLEQQKKAKAAASKVVVGVGADGEKMRKRKVMKMVKSIIGCYGCGAPLQTTESDAPGYVDVETYELKKKHHQLRTILCGRCRLLSHGHMITAVGGHGGYPGGKQFVTAEQLRDKLSHLCYGKALIVKLVDIVDFSGSFLSHVRDLVGSNPIILVITKVDLLPKGTDLNCIGDWVVEATVKKRLNVLSVHLTSSKSAVGISGVVSEIQKEKKGRDVYILGAANVGKSAFINAMLTMMAKKDPVALAAQKYKPIQSAVPGTTLGPIQIKAFLSGKLYDTPGVHLHHRQAAVVNAEDLPALAPRNRFGGQPFPNQMTMSDETVENRSNSHGLNGFSIFWGGLARVDILKVLPSSRLTFYGPNALQLHMVPTSRADEFYQKEIGVSLTPPNGKERAVEWMGLQSKRKLHLEFKDPERPVCDIAISGLGWITVEPICKALKNDSHPQPYRGELHLAVHVPKQVEVFIRPPMPVGKDGGEWYEYRELTEVEQETRPKWHF
ncbi:NO-associated protein 1, chloroplastic/mitochondrial-like protein [Drosera capensis]